MENLNGLSHLRFFLLQEGVELNKLLREDTKQWSKIEAKAHELMNKLDQLKRISCYEQDLLDEDQSMAEGTAKSAQLIFMDFARQQQHNQAQNHRAVADFLRCTPS